MVAVMIKEKPKTTEKHFASTLGTTELVNSQEIWVFEWPVYGTYVLCFKEPFPPRLNYGLFYLHELKRPEKPVLS